MKKLIYILFFALLAVSLLSSPAYAADGAELTVSADKTDVHPGDTVVLTFAVSNPAGSPVAGLQYTVDLPEGLEYKNHTLLCGNYFGAANYNAAAANLFVTNTAALEGMSNAKWDVMTITCEVADDVPLGEKTVGLSEIAFYGGVDLTDIPYTAGKAVVTASHTDSQHVWDEAHSTVTKTPACTETGIRTYTCAVEGCGKTRTEVIPATGHIPSTDAVVTDPTCTESGYRSYKCSVCGEEVKGEEIPALGHAWDEGVVTKAPSCTEEGVKTFTCKNNGEHTRTEAVPALGHAWDEGVVTKAPSCTEEGVKTFTCKNNGEHTRTEAVPTLGHAWDEGVVTKAPSCTEAGVKTFTCQNDGTHTYTEEIAALGHLKPEDESQISVNKEATCTEPGEISYICTQCGETLTEAVPALGHAWDDGTVTRRPSADAKGERTYTCARCGETRVEAIPALGGSASGGTQPVSPQTGDEAPAALYMWLLALCLSGLVLCLRRKRT